MIRKIKIKVKCGEKTCDECEYLETIHTGLYGEFHPYCKIFYKNGKWGKLNMVRSTKCIRAERFK
jgi:hypothetical protein